MRKWKVNAQQSDREQFYCGGVHWKMSRTMEELARIAIDKMSSSSTIEELEKVVGIAKSAAEASKISQDVRYAAMQARIESLKAWPNFIIPLVSILTLFATVYVQNQQLETARQQNEATQWREFLNTIEKSPNKIISDVTFAPRLESFIHSRNFGVPATEVASRLLGNVVDQAGFDDLFSVLFPDEENANLGELVSISRSLSRVKAPLYSRCDDAMSKLKQTFPEVKIQNCTDSIAASASDKARNSEEATKLAQASQELSTWSNEIFKVSQVIASTFKRNLTKFSDQSQAYLSIKGAYIYYSDLSYIDFKSVDLSGCTFDQVNLVGSRLSTKKIYGLDVLGSNWWDASAISADLLPYLIDNSYPGIERAPNIVVINNGFDKEYYYKKVGNLCENSGISCDRKIMKYGTPYIGPVPAK